MDSSTIDQGTVIFGIRSKKYPTAPCYGVVITARCDIAQKKVPKYYYLVAVDASAWFSSEHGYQQAYAASIKQKREAVYRKAADLQMNGEVLLSVSEDSRKQIIESKKRELSQDRKNQRKADELIKLMDEYDQLAQVDSNDSLRKIAVKNNQSTAAKYLADVDAGKYHHYYYLPQMAYLSNGIKNRGLLVDMLEIGTLSLSDAKKISSPFPPDICYSTLPKIPQINELSTSDLANMAIVDSIVEHMRLRESFWLESDEDFVGVEGTTSSPWCEHLMQRFSNVFIRIGLENPTQQDFEALIAEGYEEDRN